MMRAAPGRAAAAATAAYGQAAQTIPPTRQIVLLYDGAIARLREAKRAIEEGRVEDRFIATQKAAAIVDALHACLDFERGGEIAGLLDRVYTYLGFRLQQINTRNDPAVCDEVATRLGELRASWSAIADGGGAVPPASPISPSGHGGGSLAA